MMDLWRNDGFLEDLNGVHFPPINGMVEHINDENKGQKDYLDVDDNSKNNSVDHNSVENIEVMDELFASKSSEDRVKINADGEEVDIVKSTRLDNKLQTIPTEVSENRDNVMIFDDELIELGSKKWSLIVYGQFIGCSIGFNEARYHIRMMWNKFGLRDVIAKNGVFYFKFQDEEGIKEVINNGPWMVNNKPLAVQKWSIDMCLNKVEPKKIPVWVKMRNVPMEAWSVKGISALASSIGKPAIMDEITAKMCVTKVGRVGFARVLVEIDAEKGIKDKIEIMYKSKSIAEGTKKVVEVEYSWIPRVCSHYKVFGHTDSFCKKKSKIVGDNESKKNNGNGFRVMQNRKYSREGLNVNKRNNVLNGQHNKMWYGKRHDGVNNKWNQNNRFEYRLRKEDEGKCKEASRNKEKDIGNINNEQANRENMKKKDNEMMNQEGSTSKENRNGNRVLGSNRFTLLNALIDEEELVPNIDQRKIVDEFFSRNKNANNGEMNGWNEEMKRYFRDKKELFDVVQDIEENEDVMDENYEERNNVLRNEVKGGREGYLELRIPSNLDLVLELELVLE
ncbi:RNA-directed DNA polymerase, eukaryota, reverse transcriptase zinc-binding domain protein [Tanacetum coccineum]|uniref:RNA-directed DNA polymerase, eukaryota, reverse transcriptase zinc-binding domain protein n=1 Tax=Tanacetum coccineum TaxID=301880 RepID=A0ABQ5AFS1_9ASTR